MPLDRLVRIGRTGREIAAPTTDEARKRELVAADQSVRGAARRERELAHGAADAVAAPAAASRAAI